jgi:hypothetical protein
MQPTKERAMLRSEEQRRAHDVQSFTVIRTGLSRFSAST